MKISHLLAAAVGAATVYVFAKNPRLYNDKNKSDSKIQKEYESHNNPRESLSRGKSNPSPGQSDSISKNDTTKPDQTSDWYGNQPHA